MGAMSVRSLLPDLGTPATGTPEAAVPPFARAVLWAHGDDAWRGEGGWTVLLDGTDRLRRLSALWQAAVAGRPDPTAPLRGWISSTFADDSPEPAVLRIPADLRRATPSGVRDVAQHMDADALAAAVAADRGARLLADGAVPLPADVADRAWDDAGYAAGVRELLTRMADSGGELAKVVISRTMTVPADDADLWRAIGALRREYPQTWVFADRKSVV